MSEDQSRSRSPYPDPSWGRSGAEGGRERSRSPRQRAEDTYSASLRLASMESLTGKRPRWPEHQRENQEQEIWRQNLREKENARESFHEKENMSVHATSPKVPTSLQDFSNPLHLLGLPGSPFSQLLAGGGANLAGLPKPADLIQQAQALQLLPHLQTVLLNPGGGTQNQTNINALFNNAADVQKVNNSLPYY